MPSIGQKSGYLEVKVPSKARGKGIKAWKAWKRRWVVLNGLTNMATQTPMVTIDMYLNESREGQQLERSTIYLENVVTIIRTHSKSHLYAFGVEAQETILYLSGQSEGDSQSWIAALRAILWPPSSRPTLELSIGSIFSVSIIESLSSMISKTLMISTVGYLITLPSVILLASLSTGCILVEWPWSYDEQVLLVESPAQEDQEKVLFVEISSGLPTSGSYYFFSENCLELHAKLTARMKLAESEKDLQDPEYRTSLAAESSLITQCKLGIQISAELLSTKSTISDEEIDISEKSRSCENLTPNRDNGNQDAESCYEKRDIYGVEFRRRQWSLKRGSTSYSSDDIPIRVLRLSSMSAESHAIMLPDRRKSVSDSDLSKRQSGYGRTSQQALEKILASGTSTQLGNVRPGTPEDQDQTNKMKSCKLLSVAQVHQRPLSVHSSISQVSRDSGVMMSQFDESNSDGKSLMGDDTRNEADDTVTNYDNRDETTGERNHDKNISDGMDLTHYQRRTSVLIDGSKEFLPGQDNSERLSFSSDTSLYSEIDNISGNQKIEDPLYEDLDKFRKDIHKLLGITANETPLKSPSGTLTRDAPPPPLPPRKYKGMTAVGPMKHKDVMKYLGVDAHYGSLDKLSATHQNAQVNQTNSKRKDIYRYLGIPSMAASQPAGLNNPELMYDCPASTRHRKNSVGETHNPNRRVSKTYVRVQSLASPPALPGKTDTLRKKKKKKLSFLKRKPSIVKKNSEGPASNPTYISFESVTADNWEDICAPHQALDVNLSEVDNPPLRKQTIECNEIPELRNVGYEAGQVCSVSPFCDTNKSSTEDTMRISASLPDVLDMSLEQKQCILNEQYAVPANCRNSIISLLSANEQKMEEMAVQPYYVNLGDLKPALNSIEEAENSLLEHPDEVIAQLEFMAHGEVCKPDADAELQTELMIAEENLYAGPSEIPDDELSDASVESNYMDMTGTILRRPKKDVKFLDDEQFLQNPARTSEYYVEVDSLLHQDSCEENHTIITERDNTS